jgi:hypothetical protein
MFATVVGRMMGAVGLMALGLYSLMAFFVPDTPGLAWVGATAAVGLAAWVYLDWEALARFFGSRGGREQLVSAVLIVVVAGICGLAMHIASKDPKRWDLTERRIHSLDPKTEQVLQDLPERLEVEVVGFFSNSFDASESAALKSFERMVDAARATGTGVRFEILDPEINVLAAREAGITSNATVIVSVRSRANPADERVERLYSPDEEELANALLRAISDRKSKVYFVSGHGERTPRTSGDEGVSMLAQHLKNLGFGIGVWESLREPTIPEDATVLIVAGPTTPLDEREAGLIREWVEAGGSLMLLAEPTLPEEELVKTGLEGALLSWGLRLQDDLILDQMMTRLGGDPAAPIADRFGFHEITSGFETALIFATARSVSEENALPGQVTIFDLARSSDQAWGETDLSQEEISITEDDNEGPVTIIALAELHRPDSEAAGRVLVAGDVDWITDGLIPTLGNLDFVTRSVGYLAKAEDVVKIPPREKSDDTLELSALEMVLMVFLVVFLVPGVTTAVAIMLWVWRKGL